MLRRSLTALFAVILAAAALVCLQSPAGAGGDGGPGSIYDQDSYDNKYEFEDEECGIGYVGRGRSKGFFTVYNAKGSDGQAFLIDEPGHTASWGHWRRVAPSGD